MMAMKIIMLPQLNIRLRATQGFTLLEVLVAIIVLTLGLLGLAALQGRALSAESEAYQRAQAVIMLDDMVEKISANRLTAPCFAQGFGKDITAITPCSGLSVDQPTMDNADAAMTEWNGLLQGDIGGALNTRGCIVRSTADPLQYIIAVAWQGLSETVAPVVPDAADADLATAIACGEDQYGDEALRRVVWTSIRFADLSGV